ncbi:esterase-like activity of phytase family protein [Mesorhizobium sp. KR2-14]|uniref:esterase-like activity of phytase family protein n=1 Tax=Mesorhizobium sp. KR2-14 TaxID=3156610 RepID=UPI0032B5D259
MRLFPARLLGLLLAAALSGAAIVAPAQAEPAPVERAEVSTRQITQFHIGRDETRFGPLEFVGGLEMVSSSRNFGGFSAMRFLTPGGRFIGVADTGFWFFGQVTRDAGQRPTGIGDFRMVQMVDAAGQPIDDKWRVDAEGLAVRDGVATVGFERDHRVAQFRIQPDDMRAPFRQLDFLVPKHELRMNRSFETVAYAPADGALKGALVVVTERSLDSQGNVFAAVLDGPRKGVFTVVRSDGFDITDGAFLPNGDLLLLERSFSMMQGVKMRLRRLPASAIGKGKVADGPVLMQADMNYQIDNMEAMDVWRRADGALVVSLMSDDNQSILQRNLYLEFLLREE